ncbi:hypothetical protein SH580_04015 [Coraliomargarita algicola]|uniref:Secreted protein n=1 Tax=Coraliomargarita algicola TaxID=3092156 RepID=A0ABZ0RN86_9BACT|nr:hypothetical protein [Coraliomargarita sp. J2-16]WPJ96871.1 hypothetical protein SH580_04015 [Coraliomargarita sp. J2-16]
MKAPLLITLGLCIAGALLKATPLEQFEKIIQERKDSFDNLPLFLETVKQSNAIDLVEGLPRLAKNVEEKETFEIHGHGFYKRIVKVSANDKNRIKEILSGETSFRPYGGPKLCGGFNPDFCVGLKGKEGTSQYLISFWCTEVKAYNGQLMLYVELSEKGHIALHEILSSYSERLPPLPLSMKLETDRSNQ